mmetsp:Transcript_45052/g.84659  ORF Transcript_45052/g.84659 Transcript_45052/m.84659 type:complete len:248 (-) Transcript_45052:215-958(-)
MHWRSTSLPIVGLVCLAVAALPALAVEEDADSDAAPSCSRSLLQQSAVETHASKIAEPSRDGAVLPNAMKAATEAEKTSVAAPEQVKVAASDKKVNLVQSSPADSPARKGVRHGYAQAKYDARLEAHATAKMLVNFAMTAWEVLIVVLVIALIVLAVGAYTTSTRKEYEWKQDARSFGFRDNLTRDQYNHSQYATKPQYGAGYGREKDDDECCDDLCRCFAPHPKKQTNANRQYREQTQRYEAQPRY